MIDLLPEALRRQGLFPAGRLDRDTTGFVLITDDGAFAHDILSPAHHVDKTYLVTLTRAVTEREAEAVRQGMTLDGERLLPASLSRIPDEGDLKNRYALVLRQGLYHQIKRMFASMGNPVVALHRSAIGGVPLDPSLSPGESRELTDAEVTLLRIASEKNARNAT